MLQISPEMEIVTRFRKGPHLPSECGKNTQGYAAIQAATKNTDLYNVDGYPFSSSAHAKTRSKKRTMTSQDIFEYTMLKLLGLLKEPYTCVFFLNRHTYIPNSIIEIVEAVTKDLNIILIAENRTDCTILSMYHKKFKLVSEVISQTELSNMLCCMSYKNDISVLVYPLAREQDVQLIDSMKASLWCFPISKHNTVVSSDGRGSYSHFVFPWSKVSMCTGYSIGEGAPRVGSNSNNLEYESKCNFYDRMVSSVPIEKSCTDCAEMSSVAREISNILKIEDAPKRSRPLSQNSITALEELKEAIGSYMRGVV